MAARAVTVYRHLLAAVGSMKPGAQQSMLLQQVKGDFAKGRKLACPKKAQAALEQAEQDLAYIKTQLSKAAKVALAQRTESPERRRGHYVVRGGQVVEGVGKGPGERAISSWREGNVDPDQLARHKANLRRFKFMDRDVPPPRGPQWS